MAALTASDMQKMLYAHHHPASKPPGGVLAQEIASPDGRRRADAIFAPLTVTGTAGLVGYEIKVSRADVMAELADPHKMDAWARYCARWWLVVSDPALIDGLDLPATWGVMAPPSGRARRSMTVVRRAPALTPINPAPAWSAVMRWYFNHTHYPLVKLRAELERAHAKQEEAERRESQMRFTRNLGLSERTPEVQRILDVIALVEKASDQIQRGDRWQARWHVQQQVGDLTAEDIAGALFDLAATRAMAQEARAAATKVVAAVSEMPDRVAALYDGLRQDVDTLRAMVAPPDAP